MVRREIRHLYHIKVISEVHVVWPRPFNWLSFRGVAARAGSVHLMLSMDRKPSQKGGSRLRPQQHHPAPQGLPFTIKCSLATGCPPEAHNQSQLKHPASSRPKCTQILQGLSAALPTQEHTSFPVWAEQYSLITTTSASNHRHAPSGRTGISIAPLYGASVTDMASPLTSCHAPRGAIDSDQIGSMRALFDVTVR